jgi:hypothetical protein
MSDDTHRWTSFSSAFSIVLSLASDRIAELGCAPIGEDPKMFVDRGGLRRLETEAVDAAIKRVCEAAYPLIFRLCGSELPRGKGRKAVLTGLAKDLRRIEKTLGTREPSRDDVREPKSNPVRRYRHRKRGVTKARTK